MLQSYLLETSFLWSLSFGFLFFRSLFFLRLLSFGGLFGVSSDLESEDVSVLDSSATTVSVPVDVLYNLDVKLVAYVTRR